MSPASKPAASRRIGEVAERVGLSLRTVRYYEEQGLIEPAGRTDGGFRLYTDDQVERLLLIKQMKPLGFTVQQMVELLDACDDLRHADAQRRQAAQARIADFAHDAAARCEHLRTQLARAEQFADQLSAQQPLRAGRAMISTE